MFVKTVKFVNKSPNKDPEYVHEGDSGFDLRAWITKDEEGVQTDDNGECFVTLESLDRRMIHTGIYVELPESTEAQVRPRSGLALKQGITVLNTPGSVDNKYTGEICVILANLSRETVKIFNGDRIAQLVIMPVYLKELIKLQKIEDVNTNTTRGANGFGSSGIK